VAVSTHTTKYLHTYKDLAAIFNINQGQPEAVVVVEFMCGHCVF